MDSAVSGRESGQVAVEAALILPLMVFMTLGIIQLTMIQHAKLMTEYAAYQAARAGIVWNGSNERMHDAAVMSLLPTIGRTDSLKELAATWGKHQLYDEALRNLTWNASGVRPPRSFNGSNLFGMIRVDTINPAYFSPIGDIWKLREAHDWQELDFDGPDSYPEVPALEDHVRKFFNLPEPDDAETVYRKATRLTIRLRYWYEMRVPFANWVIFTAWYASNAGVALSGSIDRPTLKKSNMLNPNADIEALKTMARGINHERGYNTVYPPEMWVLWGLAHGEIPLLSDSVGKRYFLPLTATYTMRMQSNFHRKWILHLNPDWGL